MHADGAISLSVVTQCALSAGKSMLGMNLKRCDLNVRHSLMHGDGWLLAVCYPLSAAKFRMVKLGRCRRLKTVIQCKWRSGGVTQCSSIMCRDSRVVNYFGPRMESGSTPWLTAYGPWFVLGIIPSYVLSEIQRDSIGRQSPHDHFADTYIYHRLDTNYDWRMTCH